MVSKFFFKVICEGVELHRILWTSTDKCPPFWNLFWVFLVCFQIFNFKIFYFNYRIFYLILQKITLKITAMDPPCFNLFYYINVFPAYLPGPENHFYFCSNWAQTLLIKKLDKMYAALLCSQCSSCSDKLLLLPKIFAKIMAGF